MIQGLAPHEALIVARRRVNIDQPEAARRVGLGLHDYVAIERGRLIPTTTTNEGAAVAAAIEREFGISATVWAAQPAEIAS